LIDAEALAKLRPAQQGLAIAQALHRTADPKAWRAAVDAIEHPDARRAAEDYLRGIAARMRALQEYRRTGRMPGPKAGA
jgi:hypothetical protein